MRGKLLICTDCGEQPSDCECIKTKPMWIKIKNTLEKKASKGE
jgi:hypothetical protein